MTDPQLLLPVPLQSIVTQTFAEHEAARIAHGWRYYNGGIDWAVSIGTPIKATADGVVELAGMDKTGYGLHLRVRHTNKDYLSLYGHGERLVVQQGDRIQAGDIILISGNSGNSTGPHLHYELRRRNTAIDPAPFFLAIPTPEPKENASWNLTLPSARLARVEIPALNIRREPSTAASYMGILLMGQTPEILDLEQNDEGVWARIGYKQWICVNYKGTQHAVPLAMQQ